MSSARIAKKIEVKHAWEASLSPFKNPLLYFRAVLTWQRPIDFGVLLVLVTIGLWAVYSYEITVLTLVSTLTVAWVVGTFLMERFNVLVPWAAILPPQYASNSDEYYSQVVNILVNIRCDWSDAWEDLATFKAVNETRYVIQVAAVGVFLAYIGTYISGSTLIILALYVVFLIPGILANSIPQRAFVIVEPYIKVYLDKVIELKNIVVYKINERINSAQGKAKAAEVPVPSAPPAHDDDHTKAE